MLQLPQTIPDPDLLLALEPEELAVKLLFLLRQRGEDSFHPNNLESELWVDPIPSQPGYPRQRAKEIGLAVAEAWVWLEAQGLVVPEEGTNGQHGWRRRIRMCYWKQWRRVRTKVRHLLGLGTGKRQAILTALSSKGYWRLSRTLATQTGITNDWLQSQGLISVRDLWLKAHGYA